MLQHRIAKLKRRIMPYVPDQVSRLNSRRKDHSHRKLFEGRRHVIGEMVAAIASLTPAQAADATFLEKEFIPSLGLNDEVLEEQPPELSASFGKGLYLWQYPNQLASYLVWLTKNAGGITSYMEIGCRWGGMFILVSEWIRRSGGQLRSVMAVDPIRPTPFIEAYFDLLRNQSAAGQSPVETTYLCDFSTSQAVREAVNRSRPDFVFIDGDHALKGALADHMLVRKNARIIVHHDICSQSCPETTILWETLKELEAHEFECFEFAGQYESVKGSFLGFGAMKRRTFS